MALTFDTANRVIESTGSITDLPAFHLALRDWEDGEVGAIQPVTHAWRALDLGGAFLYQADLMNGWTLKFPTPGNYTITGNLNGTIVPVAGVYVERKTSAAYVTTSVGSSGPTPGQVSDAVWQRGIESSLTAEQLLRVVLSALAGKADGIGTATEHYLAADGVTPRITATFDTTGNRTNMTLNGSP